jgi:hypothetical protein
MAESAFPAGLRAEIRKTLADCENVIVSARSVVAQYPALAPDFAPDNFAAVYQMRDWARAALAALERISNPAAARKHAHSGQPG